MLSQTLWFGVGFYYVAIAYDSKSIGKAILSFSYNVLGFTNSLATVSLKIKPGFRTLLKFDLGSGRITR